MSLYIDEAPPGSLGVAQQSDWMTTEIIMKWINHFQSFVKASIDDKVIQIVDGHASHKGIETLEYAKENGIHVICLPPHCTHRMQPLDVSFFGPLKTYYNQEIAKWLKAHPGRVVTHLQIAGFFNEAYGKAATVQNACHGFKSTGIWPLNPDIFPDYIYEPAGTTNIPLEDSSNEQPSQLATVMSSVESGQVLTHDEEDCACIYCNDLYSRSKPGEDWLRCVQCSLWAHASCADVPRRTKRFICELCQ